MFLAPQWAGKICKGNKFLGDWAGGGGGERFNDVHSNQSECENLFFPQLSTDHQRQILWHLSQ